MRSPHRPKRSCYRLRRISACACQHRRGIFRSERSRHDASSALQYGDCYMAMPFCALTGLGRHLSNLAMAHATTSLPTSAERPSCVVQEVCRPLSRI
eukprot:4379847-Pleurochrysis_carterae.AAC.2